MTATGKISLAVALKYEAPGAPKVVAVGRGDLGKRIVDTAREHGVPLEENAPLAEALASVEVESEIPRELYAAIATILAFIMRASTAPAAPPLKP
jgi:flagellar biosynthesis protein